MNVLVSSTWLTNHFTMTLQVSCQRRINVKESSKQKKETTGYLRDINGIWHIVIIYYDAEGKRRFSSISTKLKIRGNKKQATRLMENILSSFNVPVKGEKVDLKRYLSEPPAYKSMHIKTSQVSNPRSKEVSNNFSNEVHPDMLFSDFLTFWLKAARRSLEDSTYGAYAMNINHRIAPYFKEKQIQLNKLTTVDLENYYNYATEHEHISTNTILKRHININQALKYAMKLKLIDENPADAVIKPKKRKYTGCAYSIEELNELFEVFKGDPLELAIYLASFYGLRREEIVGIKWSNVDFDNHMLIINNVVTCANIDGKLVEIEKERTKNNASERTYPLIKQFEDLLFKIKAEQNFNKKISGRSYNPEYIEYVYVDKMGNRIKPGFITQHFNRILKKHDLRHIRFHDLRHTCATLMLNNGENLVKVQKWLGHSNISTTANVYSHLDYQSKIDSAAKMSEIMPKNFI